MRVRIPKTKRGLKCHAGWHIVHSPCISTSYWNGGIPQTRTICMQCIGKQLLEVERGRQRMGATPEVAIGTVAQPVLSVPAPIV
jgi:hypothetical protein